MAKKPLTRVSKRVPGVYGKEGVGEGLAEKVGKGLAKGWRKVGEGLAKGWHRVGEGLADFLAPSNSRGARLEDWVCDSMAWEPLPNITQALIDTYPRYIQTGFDIKMPCFCWRIKKRP